MNYVKCINYTDILIEKKTIFITCKTKRMRCSLENKVYKSMYIHAETHSYKVVSYFSQF